MNQLNFGYYKKSPEQSGDKGGSRGESLTKSLSDDSQKKVKHSQ